MYLRPKTGVCLKKYVFVTQDFAPGQGAQISLTWRAYFSELKTAKNWWKKNPKLFLNTLYILKYSYALMVKS